MRLIFIEEASRTFSSDSDNRYDLGDGPGMGFFRSARKIDDGTAVFITDQTPGGLNRATIANCANFITFTLVDSKDVQAAAYAEGLELYERRELVTLGRREVIARLQRYPRKALKIQVDEITFPPALSREQARQQSKPFLEEIPYVKQAEEEKEKEDAQKQDTSWWEQVKELPPRTRMVYAHIAEKPWLLIEDRMDALGLDRDSENAARNELRFLGLIRFAGKVGAKNVLYELSKRGKEVAEKWA